MKNIGLFCGSFNPIHIGHTTLANTILHSAALDEIWFVVSPHNPLKKQSELLDEQKRLTMVNLALQDYKNMHSSDIEFHLSKPSYTANTLRALSQTHPEYCFSLIIGSDNLQVFNKWREYQYILDNYNIIVYPRQGDNIHQLLKTYPQVRIINAPLLPISSTQIRAMLSAQPTKDSAQQWLAPQVWNYICQNNLY